MYVYIYIYIHWLVVYLIPTPLKNMSSSVGMMTFPTKWKHKIHVPNHQPVYIPHIWCTKFIPRFERNAKMFAAISWWLLDLLGDIAGRMVWALKNWQLAMEDPRIDGPLRVVICWVILGFKMLQKGTRAIAGFHFGENSIRKPIGPDWLWLVTLKMSHMNCPMVGTLAHRFPPNDMSSGLFATISHS